MKGITFIFSLISIFSFAQIEVGSLYEEMPMDSLYPLSLNLQTNIKPAIRIFTNYSQKYAYGIGPKEDTLCKYLYISPLVDLGFSTTAIGSYRTGLGATITSNFLNKWYFKISAVEGIGETKNQLYVPKAFIYHKKTSTNYYYTDLRGRISYTPNHVFNFQTGIDHNFIGEGNRSMLLSDFGKPYPFAMIRTKVARFEYTMLYQFFKETKNSNQSFSKYATSHFLSYNISRNYNIGLFETVIFSPKDTTLNRGYDAEYLNPIVFFRPQEYALGSPDNIILGFVANAKIDKHTFYSQFILDEFLLSELKAKSKWWGNKYGAQIGVKGHFTSHLQRYFYRLETNFARPYTYSHSSYSQNYGNQGLPLAHPLGANFYEFLGELKWQNKKWSIKTSINYALVGMEKNDKFSYVSDIYLSYNKRFQEYGNKIGNGIKINTLHFILTGSYLVDQATNLQLFIENHIAGNSIEMKPNYLLVVGFRSCLWNDYRNY